MRLRGQPKGSSICSSATITPVEAIAPGPGLSIDVARTVNGAPWLSVSLEEGHALSLRLDGVDVMRAPSAPEPAIFAGRGVAFALRNGEPASRVLDWLAYHMRHHAMSGALIISRGTQARIIDITLFGQDVHLRLDGAPEPEGPDPVSVSYAWGASRSTTEAEASDRPANTGALRDTWSAPSLLQPGRDLHRFALAAHLPLMESDL